MWSYQITDFGAPLERTESETPEPRGTEVLLEVQACGVCHSDLHYWTGGYDLGAGRRFTLQERGVQLPITLGHEPFGTVVAVGEAVDGVSPGQEKAIYPWVGCGECRHCRAGRDIDCTSMRTIGLFSPGGYASHVMVPHPRYLVDSGGLPAPQAATLACAGLTAWGALRKALPLDPEDAVVLIGAGGVGLSAVGLARAMLDRKLIVVDTDENRLSSARTLGADHVVVAGAEAKERLLDLTGGGAGAVIDFVGAPDTFRLGQDALRRGGKLVLVGLFGGSYRLPIPMLPLRNISIVGSLTGTVAEMRDVTDFVCRNRVRLAPYQTRPFEMVNQTLQDLEAGRIVGRVILVP